MGEVGNFSHIFWHFANGWLSYKYSSWNEGPTVLEMQVPLKNFYSIERMFAKSLKKHFEESNKGFAILSAKFDGGTLFIHHTHSRAISTQPYKASCNNWIPLNSIEDCFIIY